MHEGQKYNALVVHISVDGSAHVMHILSINGETPMNAQHTASDHTMTIDGRLWGTLDAFLDRIDEQGGIPDIGQFHPTVLKGLKALVKSGALVTYRGYWDSLSSAYGLGPLKTIYASPEFANARAEMDAGIKARFQ